jgi:hypothetical protein
MAPLGGAASNKTDRCEEEIFQGMDQHTVLMAIADLASALIVPSIEADGDEDYGVNWARLADVVAEEMRRTLLGEVPLPPHQ